MSCSRGLSSTEWEQKPDLCGPTHQNSEWLHFHHQKALMLHSVTIWECISCVRTILIGYIALQAVHRFLCAIQLEFRNISNFFLNFIEDTKSWQQKGSKIHLDFVIFQIFYPIAVCKILNTDSMDTIFLWIFKNFVRNLAYLKIKIIFVNVWNFHRCKLGIFFKY